MQFLKKDQLTKIIQNKIINNYKICYPRQKISPFVTEKRKQEQKEKQYRKMMIEKYWKQQTEKENKFIEEYDKQQFELKLRKLQRWRTQIAIQSQRSIELIKFQEEKNKEKKQKYLKWKLEEENKHNNRLRMIQVLKINSQNWFNHENLEEKMNEEMLIPNMVYNKTDYYVRLQEQCMMLENGDYDQLDDGINNRETLKFKNKKLIPMFNEIKYIIKHMKGGFEWKYQQELKVGLIQIQEKFFNKGQEFILQQQEQLKIAYQKVIEKTRKEQDPLKNIEQQLISLYNLINQWQNYISLVKTDNKKIQVMRELELKQDKMFYHAQQNQKNQQEDEDDDENQWDIDNDMLNEMKSQEKDVEGEMSANEKMTSSDEESQILDAKQFTNNRAVKEENMKKKLDTFTKISQQQKNNVMDQFKTKQQTEREIDLLFSQWEKKAEESLQNQEEDQQQKEIEENVQLKQINLSQLLYGYIPENFKEDQNKYKKISQQQLKQMFNQEEIEDIDNFNQIKLKYNSLESIIKRETNEDDNSLIKSQLQTSILVEYVKAELRKIQDNFNHNQQSLKKIKQLYQVINIIGELQLDEPVLLQKLIQVHDPSYYNL